MCSYCWRVPLAGRQVTVFLVRKLCPRRRVKSQLFGFGVRLWQWCVLAALLCLYQDPLHNGSRAKSDLWSHFIRPQYVFSNWCAIAYVVSPKSFAEPWCIWIGWTVADTSTRLSLLSSIFHWVECKLHISMQLRLHL